ALRGRRAGVVIGGRCFTGCNDRDGCFKSKAAMWNRFDEAHAVGSDSASQFTDALHKRVIGNDQVRPDSGKELVFRYNAAAIFDKITHDGEGLWTKGNLVRVKEKSFASQIHNVSTESQQLRLRPPKRMGIVGHDQSAICDAQPSRLRT